MRIARLAPLLLALALPSGGQATSEDSYSLVQLTRAAACSAAPEVIRAGGVLVAPELAIWRLRSDRARELAPRLRRAGVLATVEPDRVVGGLAAADFSDPLVPTSWWRNTIGVADLTPPGPGKPVTIVDSGLDLAHPEFAGRPDTVVLNEQTTTGRDGPHGTAVASLVAAPENGVGMVGVYPQAALRFYDASPGGRQLTTSEIIAGILAAAREGPSVINLSLGSRSRDSLLEQSVYQAYAEGSLIVAAAGNERAEGNPVEYPASLPHVLTVAATDRANAVASFSNRSLFNDLAAPGVGMTVAVPTALGGTGFLTEVSGTSFAAPLVSGAAAWVWTVRPDLDNTQLFEIMRRSALDIGPRGFDDESGFGLLSVPAALAYPAPVRDPSEPNDDLEFVKPDGYFSTSRTALTVPGRERASLVARLDRREDVHDVYRIWLPPKKLTTVTLRPNAEVDLTIWSAGASSVYQAPESFRLGFSGKLRKATEAVALRNETSRGSYAYVDAALVGVSQSATYSLLVATKALPKQKPKPRTPAQR